MQLDALLIRIGFCSFLACSLCFPTHLLHRLPPPYKCTQNSSFFPQTKQPSCLVVMAGIVVVFDFDKTIIDCDSDNWVVDEFGFTDLFNQFLPTMPWNVLMDTMMNEIHSHGRTIQEIEDILKKAPIHPKAISAIKAAHALGCDLKVVSDANTFFIETILKHHGLIDYFSEINTNPGFVDEEGRLRIMPYHDFLSSSHGCDLCPPNMCKSVVIERIKACALAEGNKKIIYLGDGKGDFCPSTKLREQDFVMPRKDYPVWDLICENPSLIKAKVYKWSNWDEQERILLNIINTIIFGDVEISPALIPSDQSFIPISEPLQQTIAVLH